jgi:hypothetical protein
MREMDSTNVIAFAGKKPPIPAHRLEWFNLIPGASEYVRGNPPPEPPGLPIPEVVISNGKSAEAPNFASASRPPRADDPPPQVHPQDGGSRGADGDEEEEPRRWGGYVEPDV